MTWPSPLRLDAPTVIERWVNGETLESIAREYDVSRQYVYMVIKSEDRDAPARHKAKADAVREAKADKRKRVSREVREARARTEYETQTRGSEGGWAERYTNRDYFEALSACAVDNGIPVGSMPGYTVYKRWYEAHPHRDTLPSPAGVVRRFRGWNATATALGLTPNESKRPSYKRKWSDAQIVEAIVLFVDEVGILNSGAQAYDAWARGKHVPSLAGIRLHNTWSHYRAIAQVRLGDKHKVE